MAKRTLKITCTAAANIPIEQFKELQGNLKTLSESNFEKLKNSILQFGFAFPVIAWQDTKKQHWVIDAHQRIAVLKKLQAEGYEVPPLPTAYIQAADKKEAKEKLLLLNSQYGKITGDGIVEFTFDLPMTELDAILELPQISGMAFSPNLMPETQNQLYSQKDVDKKAQELVGQMLKQKQHVSVTCPFCYKEFEVDA